MIISHKLHLNKQRKIKLNPFVHLFRDDLNLQDICTSDVIQSSKIIQRLPRENCNNVFTLLKLTFFSYITI